MTYKFDRQSHEYNAVMLEGYARMVENGEMPGYFFIGLKPDGSMPTLQSMNVELIAQALEVLTFELRRWTHQQKMNGNLRQ